MHILYSMVAAVGLILAVPYFLWKSRGRGKYFHNLRERLGALPPEVLRAAKAGAPDAGAIWIHAVSVGELLAALPLARALKQQHPARKLFLSTTTDSGQRLARERATFADGIFYFPLDFAFAVRRVLRVIRPSLILVMETEIWPNFLCEAKRGGARIVFVNGRLSESSFGGYQRWKSLTWGFLARALQSADGFLMQSADDAARIRALGAPAERVHVTGNLKYDQPPPAETSLAQWLAAELARTKRPLIVAGSVTAHEEPYVLIAFGIFQGQFRDALLLLAPRKPERFDAAAAHIEESQRTFVRRSQLDLRAPLPDGVGVILLDSLGELASLYELATGVFVGGSLVEHGGHNILEPAAAGRVPIFGPHMDNFREIAAAFLAANAAIQVSSPEDLGVAWIELYQTAARREQLGAAARALVEQNRGATARTVAHIGELLPPAAAASAADPASAAKAESAAAAASRNLS